MNHENANNRPSMSLRQTPVTPLIHHDTVDVLVIGGGSAGMAAALAAEKAGAKKILIVERDQELGGILNQCIHSGFGLHHFKEELTGPQYAHRFIQEVKRSFVIQVLLNTTVLSMSPTWESASRGKEAMEKENLSPFSAENSASQSLVEKIDFPSQNDFSLQDPASQSTLESAGFPLEAVIINQQGCQRLLLRSAVLAMGCRERTGGAIGLQGYRPAGILTAGAAQRLINMEGLSIGKNAVIYGSGDIGLIMARRLTLEGCRVGAVIEIQPRCNGLRRNVEQCLHDFDIPLFLGHAITTVHGKHHITGICVAPLDAQGQVLRDQEFHLDCDTLLLSVGLIPENELTRSAGAAIHASTKGPRVSSHLETTLPGVFACGNVLHVHDIVDFVTEEGAEAGRHAAVYALQQRDASASQKTYSPKESAASQELFASQKSAEGFFVTSGDGITYVLPQLLLKEASAPCLRLRVKEPIKNCTVALCDADSQTILCSRSIEFAEPSQMIRWSLPQRTWEDLLNHTGSHFTLKIQKE